MRTGPTTMGDVLRLYHLAYCELGVDDVNEVLAVAQRYVAGEFEIEPGCETARKAPQTCRMLRDMRRTRQAALEGGPR